MTFNLEITEYDNAAFSGGDFYATANEETARILRRVADRIEAGETEGGCMDICGNKVGNWAFNGYEEV